MAREGQHWDKAKGKYVDDDIFDPSVNLMRGRRTFANFSKVKNNNNVYNKTVKPHHSNDEFLPKTKYKKTKVFPKSATNFYSTKQKQYQQDYHSNKSNKQVVVRITGNNSTYEGLANHLHYISRNGEREMTSSEGEVFRSYSEIKDAYNSFGINEAIPTEAELIAQGRKPRKEVVHIIMSMQGKEHNLKAIETASQNTIKKVFPDQYFVSATHDDTDNNHCHIAMRARNELTNKAINIDKRKLDEMKITFAQELNKLGIEAEHNVKYRPTQDELKEQQKKQKHFKVVAFGNAPFNFDKNKQQSYYVTYQTEKGEELTIWSENLQSVIEQNHITIGEYCRFEMVDAIPTNKTVTFKDKHDENISYRKNIYAKVWDVSIKDRAEKELTPMPRDEYRKLVNSITVIYNDSTKYTKDYHNNPEKYQEQSEPREYTTDIRKVQDRIQRIKKSRREYERENEIER